MSLISHSRKDDKRDEEVCEDLKCLGIHFSVSLQKGYFGLAVWFFLGVVLVDVSRFGLFSQIVLSETSLFIHEEKNNSQNKHNRSKAEVNETSNEIVIVVFCGRHGSYTNNSNDVAKSA